ncbi:MAG: ABC transporter ATP-binding protein [Clostridia bacterium]|nr:ABC transporter ATP-binding protein [Clostridia bacterium]
MLNDTTPVLTVNGLSKKLGGRRILKGISFCVYPGEVFGFLGPNGSGKTTTIKLMLGLLGIDEGSICICGHNVVYEFEDAMECVGGIIENPEMYKYLSGKENLRQYARMYDGITEDRINEVVKLVGLENRIGEKISKYSLGMRQRLGLAQAILHRPRLLVLDEPTNGLDPAGIKELRDIIRSLTEKEGTAVFISSHQLAELDLICDRIGIISSGELLRTMTIDEVRNSGGSSAVITVEIDPGTNAYVPKFLEHLRTENPSVLHGELEHEAIPDTVAALCDCGVRIYSVEAAKRSIEDVFLDVTGVAAAGSDQAVTVSGMKVNPPAVPDEEETDPGFTLSPEEEGLSAKAPEGIGTPDGSVRDSENKEAPVWDGDGFDPSLPFPEESPKSSEGGNG